jgi:hypothetical protein
VSTNKKKMKPAKKKEGIVDTVTNFARTSIFAGLGFAFLPEEIIEDWVKKFAKENNLSTKDAMSFIRSVKKESIIARNGVEKRVKNLVDDIFSTTKKKKPGTNISRKKKKVRKATKKSHAAAASPFRIYPDGVNKKEKKNRFSIFDSKELSDKAT